MNSSKILKTGSLELAPSSFDNDYEGEEEEENGEWELELGKCSRRLGTKPRLFDFINGYETELNRQCFLTTQFNTLFNTKYGYHLQLSPPLQETPSPRSVLRQKDHELSSEEWKSTPNTRRGGFISTHNNCCKVSFSYEMRGLFRNIFRHFNPEISL